MALMKLCRCGKVIDYTDKYCSECVKKNVCKSVLLNKNSKEGYNML
ncbi:hypothetical protein LGL55_10555 [Clostridium tagluense]|nr:hypothetical protein [Clostridium tagluense]MCB2311620.1 hypothetical protein [Clostridium tagluense]MCB2316344.1 hypothetical protein [Clostridium tagluense]MCB2321272.1 hypothetical protein [Clostridium tagluense]MCB2326213.1 hypothetical protein [Clostridium tagluense]MCB2331008.1 hypothetical protein [Clostridium tagluense]